MSEVRSWKGRTHSNADCLVCGDRCDASDYNGGAHRSWARRHVQKHPGHEVHVEVQHARVYKSEPTP